jgi:hypothetical protein
MTMRPTSHVVEGLPLGRGGYVCCEWEVGKREDSVASWHVMHYGDMMRDRDMRLHTSTASRAAPPSMLPLFCLNTYFRIVVEIMSWHDHSNPSVLCLYAGSRTGRDGLACTSLISSRERTEA